MAERCRATRGCRWTRTRRAGEHMGHRGAPIPSSLGRHVGDGNAACGTGAQSVRRAVVGDGTPHRWTLRQPTESATSCCAVVSAERTSSAVTVPPVAAVANIWVHGLEWDLTVPLILGSVPGTLLGARFAAKVPQSVIRRGIVIVLTMSGVALMDKAGWAPLGKDDTHPGVIGHAPDGGRWLLGLTRPEEAGVLADVPMSTPRTAIDTRRALARQGVRLATTRTLRDVDTVADADRVAREAPGSRFAEAWAHAAVEVA